MTPSDILYVLFKHKWKILFFAVAGLVGAGAVFKFRPGPLKATYVSEAQLYIRYVQEAQANPTVVNDSRIKSPDQRGETIISNEIAIITSYDLAKEVASVVGPDRILGAPLGKGDSETIAGMVVQGSLKVDVVGRSSILSLKYRSGNPEIVQPVLREIVRSYLKRHASIHRSAGLYDDFLTQETDQLRAQIAQTEDELRRLKENSGILSMEESISLYSARISDLRVQIMASEASLAEQTAILSQMTGNAPNKDLEVADVPSIPDDAIKEYARVETLLNTLKTREREALLQFTPASTTITRLRAQIASNQKTKEELENQHPLLTASKSPSLVQSQQLTSTLFDARTAMAQIRATESRIRILRAQLEQTEKEAIAVNEVEPLMAELERRKAMQETRYRTFQSSLEQARIDEALGAGTISNISIVQEPSPPGKEAGKLLKIILMIAVGGIGVGIALAFGSEMFINQTLRRPSEVEGTLALPLFFSIPRLRHSKKRRKKKVSSSTALAVQDIEDGVDAWERHPDLKPVCESLRDRLIFNFEARDLTRKPKLVGITGCGEDSGVSTIAAGLAASLSETGEGNVLLVDMKPGENTPHHFRQGSLQVGLDEALQLEKRDDAKAGEHLFVVSESAANGSGPKGMLPTRFTSLVPKMKASDFDYIIFDMPPITHNSVATSLARYMDTTLMVVESEKTNRNTVKKAGEMLAETGVEFGVVLNKSKEYIPKIIQQGLLGDE